MPNLPLLRTASAALPVLLFLWSCSSGPNAPQPGTPAFDWAAANQTWKSGDYVKTLDNLARITSTSNEFTARARPWQIVVAAGVARADMDMAQAFEDGARRTRQRPAEFLNPMNAWRTSASRAALQLAEAFGKFSAANADHPVRMDFAWPPAGNASVPRNLDRVAAGNVLPADQLDELTTALVRRDVLLSIARATGSADDVAKARALFDAPVHDVPAAQFCTGMAKALFDIAGLYGPTKMDMPNKRDFLFAQAISALRPYAANKDAADITTKIHKQQAAKTTI